MICVRLLAVSNIKETRIPPFALQSRQAFANFYLCSPITTSNAAPRLLNYLYVTKRYNTKWLFTILTNLKLSSNVFMPLIE